MVTSAEKLSCIAMIVCDQIFRDEASKKLIVVGTFNNIQTSDLPCRHPFMSVLFTITNGHGEYELSLAIEHERSGHEVVELRGPFRIDDPLAISEVNVVMRDLVFPEAGKYWLVLKADGELLQQRPFWVKLNETAQRN